MTGFFAAVCAGFVGLLLYAERKERIRLKWLAKPAASAAFIAVGVAGLDGAVTLFDGLLIAGLVLCALGDGLLIPRREAFFLAGMGAFGLGHLAYAGAFLSYNASLKPSLFIGAVVMTVMATATLRMVWSGLGAFRGPVIVYMAVITAMALASLAATPAAGGHDWVIVAGAFGFALSDVAVARDQFARPEFMNRLWGLPLYYGSQLLLAASVGAA
ncbi:MAG: lysoplasmalogenase [Pseudomonadota bacterium]